MSQNINITESPQHFVVLDAISSGIGDVGKIAKVTKIGSKVQVELILNDLFVQRLITTEQKRGLFSKKVQARITNTGSKLLTFKKQELEEKARDLKSMYMNRDKKGMESFMEDNRAWIPMMIFSGIMSAMVFASMMTFMGMAMNPAEAAMTGDAVNGEAQAAADTQSESANDGNNGGSGDTGGDTGTDGMSSLDSGTDGFIGDFEF